MKNQTVDIFIMPILFTGFIGLIRPEANIFQLFQLFLLLLLISFSIYLFFDLILYREEFLKIKTDKQYIGIIFLIIGIINLISNFQFNGLVTGLIILVGFIFILEEKWK